MDYADYRAADGRRLSFERVQGQPWTAAYALPLPPGIDQGRAAALSRAAPPPRCGPARGRATTPVAAASDRRVAPPEEVHPSSPASARQITPPSRTWAMPYSWAWATANEAMSQPRRPFAATRTPVPPVERSVTRARDPAAPSVRVSSRRASSTRAGAGVAFAG